jgi:REP-associated tyrosine transposase
MSATHFITLPTFHRKRIFQNERFGEVLTEVLMHSRRQFDILLHDYVIMPDHAHLLLTGEVPVAQLINALQKEFAKEIALQFGYAGEVWESQFDDQEIKSAKDCAECAKHIHSNPVRVGFCDKPGEYRMSSTGSRWLLDPLPEALRAETTQTA